MRTRFIIAAASSLFALTACGGGESSGDAARYCEMAADASLDPSENPELFDEFVAVAPAEIRGEIELVAELTKEFLELEAADALDGEAAAALEERFASDEVVAAFDELDAYDVDECGVDTGA